MFIVPVRNGIKSSVASQNESSMRINSSFFFIYYFSCNCFSIYFLNLNIVLPKEFSDHFFEGWDGDLFFCFLPVRQMLMLYVS